MMFSKFTEVADYENSKTMELTSSLIFLLHFSYVIWLKCRSKSSKHSRNVPVWVFSPYFSAVINYIVKSIKWDFASNFETPLKCVIVVHSLNVPWSHMLHRIPPFLTLEQNARGMWLFYSYTSQVVTTTANAQVLLPPPPQPAVIHTDMQPHLRLPVMLCMQRIV